MLWGRLIGSQTISPILIFGEGRTDTVNRTTYTFSNMDLNEPSYNRYIIVAFNERGVDPNATVTVAGQSCTQRVLLGGGTNSFGNLFVTNSPITTGTSGDVVISNTTERSAVRVATYALYTSRPMPNYIATEETQSNPRTITSPLASNQVGIVYGQANTSSSLSNFTVSGPIVQNYYSGISENGAMIVATITGSGTVTFATTGTGSGARAFVATWS